MIIKSVEIEKYAIVKTTVGDFRVDIAGTVEYFKESQYGFYEYVYLPEDELGEMGLTLKEYRDISLSGLKSMGTSY